MAEDLKETLKTSGEVESVLIETSTGVRMEDCMYDDVSYTFVGRRLTSTRGTSEMDWDKNVVVFQKSGDITDENDRVQGSEPYLHLFKNGTVLLYPHFHWNQYNDSDQYTVIVKYRVTNMGEAYMSDQSDWTTISTITCTGNDAFPFDLDGKDVMHQLTTFDPVTVDIGLSSEIEMMFVRSDSNSFTEDLEVKRFDFHAPIDKLGSRNPYNDNE